MMPKKKIVTRVENELIRSQPSQRHPTRSMADSSERMVTSTIRDIRARMKSKQSNTQMGRRNKAQ